MWFYRCFLLLWWVQLVSVAVKAGVGQIVTVAATQMSCGNPEENIKKAESLVRIASSRGAQIILLQELFQFSYFPIELNAGNLQLATTLDESALVQGMALLAKELRVVIPISFFERYGNSYYNSCAVIDADGSVLGIVRKLHIGGEELSPNDPERGCD